MEIFYLTLKQMLMMFTLILVGVFIRKKCNIDENSGNVMAKLETYIFVPALSLFTQMTNCTVESFKENFVLILYGTVVVLCVIAVSYPLSKAFIRKKSYLRNVYQYALCFGNYGFMGNFIVLGIWGSAMFYKYSLFVFTLGILCSSWGLYILIPKEENAGIVENLKKGLLTPPVIALFLGIFIGISDLTKYVPGFVLDALDEAGRCQGPVAMVLAGFVIGGYNFKKLILNKKVYVVTFFRLILIPAVILVILKLFGASKEMMILALIAFATPIGMNTIVFPAAYGGDTETGASMTMVSHTLSVITIPLMYLIFIEIL